MNIKYNIIGIFNSKSNDNFFSKKGEQDDSFEIAKKNRHFGS